MAKKKLEVIKENTGQVHVSVSEDKGPMPGLEVKTPYPKKIKKSDTDFIGDELVKLTNRVNELELSLESMRLQVNKVTGRMGL